MTPTPALRLPAIAGLAPMASKADGNPPPALFEALDDESAANRAAAANTLAGYRRGLDPAIPPLLRHLEDAGLPVRDACAGALRKIQPPAVTPAVAPAVIAALQTPDRIARENLVTLLGRLKPDPRAAVPALIAVLREPIDSDVKVVEISTLVYDAYSGPAHAAARELARIAPARRRRARPSRR